MSKVKIQGNASGTGVLTVTAPNTSTDRTITLPDSTGTLLTADGDGSSLTGVGVDGISSSADATAITIDSAENVGFGSAPTSFYSGYTGLQLGGNGAFYGQTSAGADKNLWLSQNARAGTDGSEKAISTGTSSQIMMSSGNVTLKTGASASANANVTWTTGFEVLADGRARAKNGLLFGTDTVEANALSDYESGTWTPNLSVKPSGVALGTVTVANYTKIGDRVFISLQCLITSSSVPAPNNDMRLTGFPFTNANSGVNMPAVFNYNYKETPQLHMNGSGYLYFQDTTVGGNNQSPAGGGLDASTTLSLAIQYKTNS